jgi:rhodanese-related sulfurtransferase
VARELTTGDRGASNEGTMPREIQRDEVRRLLESGAQLVEVLPAESYDGEHIAGAMNLPLEQLSCETAERLLRKDLPIVTYCHDAQ